MADENKDPASVTPAVPTTEVVTPPKQDAPVVKQDAPIPVKQGVLDAPVEPTKPKWEYKQSEDADVNIMSGILARGDISPDEAAELFKGAVESLDINKANWAEIEKKLGKEQAYLLKLTAGQVYSTHIATKQAVITATHEAAGGEDNWVKVRDWAREAQKTDAKFAEQVKQYNKMFDLGATSAQLATRELINAYNADKRNTTLNTTVINGDTTVKPAAENLSRADYVSALLEAQKKGDKAEMERLRSARRAFYAS